MKKQLLVCCAIAMAFASIAQTWTKTSTFSNAVNAHTLTTLANGDVLQVAGDSGFQVYIDDVNLYNVVNDLWTPVANYPTTIENHVAFATSETTVLVIGGSIAGTATDAVYEYDTETDAWTAKAVLPKALESVSAVELEDGKILVTAGWKDWTPNEETYIYDPSTEAWSTVASLPQGLVNSTIALLGNGDVVIAGGLNGSFETVASSYVYNVAANTWTAVGDIAYAISGGAMSTSLTDGNAIFVGGFDFLTGTFHDKVLVYDAETQVWDELLTLDAEISNGAVVAFENNTVLIAGGNNGSKADMTNKPMNTRTLNGIFKQSTRASLSSAYIVDLETGVATAEDDLPEARQAAKHTVLNDGRILITGGAGEYLADESYNDGLIYEKSLVIDPVNISFTIVDENDMTLELASIIFNKETLSTDINGTAVFSAVSGTTSGYTVTMDGYETVEVADNDADAIIVGILDIEKTIALTPVVGIETIANKIAVNIYPTISNGNITVEGTSNYNLTLKVINQQGQLVKTISNIEGSQNINLDVNKGLYIIVTESNNTTIHTQKLIIQ